MLAPTVKRLGVVMSLTALAVTAGCSESPEKAGPYGKVSEQDKCAFIPGEQLLEDEGDTWHAPVEDALTTGCMTPIEYKKYEMDKAQREQDQRKREAARQQAEEDLHDLVQASQGTEHPEIMLPVHFVCSSTNADELTARWGPAYETYAASWRIQEVEALEAGHARP